MERKISRLLTNAGFHFHRISGNSHRIWMNDAGKTITFSITNPNAFMYTRFNLKKLKRGLINHG